jgi:competence protein ComEC
MKRPACVIGICLMLTLRMLFLIRPPDTGAYRDLDGRQLSASGTVDDKYEKNENIYLILKDSVIISGAVRTGDESGKTANRIKVKLKEAYPSLSEAPAIGERVRISGKGMAFSEARNPGNFDQAEYELIYGVDFEIYGASVTEVGERRAGIREGMCLLKKRLSDTAEDIYGKERAQIIKAVVLGDKNDLSDEVKSAYRRAGMSHVLCISGLHISFVGMGLFRLLRKVGLRKGLAYALALAFTVSYGALTGMGVSVIRAVLMFGIVILAESVGRTPDLLSSVAAAGVIVMAVRPLYVLDTGFTLSFAAVSGIGVLNEVMEEIVPFRGRIWESLRSSLAVTIFMLPVSLYYFYQIPLMSVPVNMLIIPLVSVLLVSAVLSLITGAMVPGLGVLTAIPAKLVLMLYDKVTEVNDALPHTQITAGRPAVWQIAVCYVGYIGLSLVIGRIRQRMAEYDAGRRIMHSLACMAILAGLILICTLRFHSPLEITMIDVGQGDCHFMIMPDGRNMMIDCGSSDITDVARYRVIPYLLSEGCDFIDYAVVTHTDEDHINGYVQMLSKEDGDEVRIGTLIMPDIKDRGEAYDRLVSLAEGKGVQVRKIHAGNMFETGGMRFDCLNPALGGVYTDANATSVCLDISYRDFRALYTGDAEGEGEREMEKRLRESGVSGGYTLLKCAHHGSENSTSEDFLTLVRPQITFISAGVDNRYGHPHRELLQRVEQTRSRVYVTKDLGAVRIDTDGKRVRIKSFIKKGEENEE